MSSVNILSKMGRCKITFCLICVLFLVAIVYGTGESYFGKESGSSCTGENCQSEDDSDSSESLNREDGKTEEINLIMTFVNGVSNPNLQKQFTQTVSSLLHHCTVPLVIHIIGEEASQDLAIGIIKNNAGSSQYRTVKLDIDQLAKDLNDIVKPMQDHFSHKPGSYYNQALFFLSIAIHRVMPQSMHKVIMIDADLKFTDDIRLLHDRFSMFTEENIIGIGREMQPVYRHTFWEYRGKNPGTRVGEPPPNGLTGFNSGVLMLDLDHMRKSELYNSLLNRESLEQLSKEFHFKGHLGDQDFFTLLSMKHEELFHVLPCVWNRQLCTWWRDHGYEKIFDDYHNCEGDIKIWHGNCNTPIP